MINDIFVGAEFKTRNYGKFIVTSIANSKSVAVEFVLTGYKTTTRFDSVRRGSVKDKMYPSVHGVGFIGIGNHKTSVNGKNTDSYRSWQRMIGRCYDCNYQSKNKTYIGCSVCVEWHNFQNFAEWYAINNKKGSHLDKDIKISGNKVYSPATCMFVTAADNVAEACSIEFSFKDKKGEVYKGRNIAEFCRVNGLDKGNMSKVNNGERLSSKGWTKA